MKRRTFITTGAAAFAASFVVKPSSIRAADTNKQYVFGFSQVTTVEPWRVEFNKQMLKEAAKHPNLKLIISDGKPDGKTSSGRRKLHSTSGRCTAG